MAYTLDLHELVGDCVLELGLSEYRPTIDFPSRRPIGAWIIIIEPNFEQFDKALKWRPGTFWECVADRLAAHPTTSRLESVSITGRPALPWPCWLTLGHDLVMELVPENTPGTPTSAMTVDGQKFADWVLKLCGANR